MLILTVNHIYVNELSLGGATMTYVNAFWLSSVKRKPHFHIFAWSFLALNVDRSLFSIYKWIAQVEYSQVYLNACKNIIIYSTY